MDLRPYYLGNYEKSEGKPEKALSYAYSTWSQFKREVLPHSLGFLAVFYLLYYAGVLFEYFRSRDLRGRIAGELLMLLGLIMGDGRADIGKHLFLFNVSFDMMAVVIFGWVVHKLVRLVQSVAGKSGRYGR
ncbi:hypothetical protein D3C86_1826500 [compost metagenome]